MGLTILAFISIPGFVALFLLAVRRGAGMPGRWIIAVIAAILAVYSLAQGTVFVLTGPGFHQSYALFIERMSGSLIVLTHFLILLLAINFPTPPPVWVRWLSRAVLLPIALAAAWDAAFSFDYIFSVYRPWTTIFRSEGRYYNIFVFGDAAIAGLAVIVFGLRMLAGKNNVQKQRSAIAAGLVLLGASLILVSTGLLTAGQARRPSVVFAPAGALLLAGGLTYAFRLSRLFDWRVIGRNVLGYGFLLGVVGLPAGVAVAALIIVGRDISPWLPAIGGIVVFVLAALAGRLFFARFFERLIARGDYRGKLESDLAGVDLAQGRDAVLKEVYGRLSKALDLTDFTVLVDDDLGFMRTVYSPTGGKATVERGSRISDLLEGSLSGIVLKSEAQTAPYFAEGREGLLELFESLKAEALIVILEGRRAIGLFGLGARRTGAEYTAYDHDSLKAVYGKLFVIVYYLKNVARESIIATVDREIALSDQVIRFALEKVDRIDHPKADASWVARSTRGLGGDFIDFVRLSQDRWFVVMGDVSGKGLSASMNMLILKSMIRTFLRVEKDFVGLVSRVNVFVKENLPRGTFFAGLFGYLDFSKDTFYYVNCGVPTVLLYSPSFDTFIDVQGEGKILGFVKDISPFLKPRKLIVPAGSALVTATDGILDSENLRGERIGRERLRHSVRERLDLPSAEIASGVM
ncbi:MAG: SpoIIE family protein phosphatase, partial [Spirochaetota bacterium]